MPKELKANKVDYGVALVRGSTSLIPLAGSVVSEFIGTVVPNQRLDRLAKYIAELERKLNRLEITLEDAPYHDEVFSDLFEEACRQAAHSVSEERRSYIATLIASGMSPEGIELAESRHLLRILGELSDVEVIWLRYYRQPTIGGDEEFRETHKTTLHPAPPGINSSPEAHAKYALQQSYKKHLAQEGLLDPRYETEHQTDIPKFDTMTGAMKIQGYQLSPLGRLLLKEIGLGEDE